jgi:outer membrane receptor protein involved in Fe transport
MFMHFNQVIGATYKISSDVTAYAGFSEADRAPTPSELGCANPAQPCMIASFLVSDPPLKQVIAHTFEAGLRGTHNYGEDLGTFGGAPFTDPRTLSPAQPHLVYAGLKATF